MPAAGLAARWLRAALALALLTPSAPAAATGPAAEVPGQVIRGACVIDVERGERLFARDVHLAGERIAHVVPSGALPVPEGFRVIEAEGLYLIPGLFDAHVHLSASPETFPPLLVAHGVTAVRDLGGPTAQIVGLRERARTGGEILPEIACTGAILDGRPPVWPFSEVCEDAAQGRAAVERLAAAGVDQIKVYERLSEDAYRGILQAARERGLPVTGHIPQAVTLGAALAAGQACNEHLTGFGHALAVLAARAHAQPAPDRSLPFVDLMGWQKLEQVPAPQLAALCERVRAAGMVQCPTLVVMRALAGSGAGEDDPRMAVIPPALRAFWGRLGGAGWRVLLREVVAQQQRLVGELYRAGVPLVCGTDLANPYVFPGSSLHEEMVLFGEAGLPPAAVLRAATLEPARLCGRARDLGSVAEGKLASLVLLRADPLADVRNTAQIEAVWLRGRYLDRAALARLVADAEAYVRSITPAPGVAPPELVPGGELLARGRYEVKSWLGGGRERFVLSRRTDSEAGGFELQAYASSGQGLFAPYVLRMELSADYRLRAAELRYLTVLAARARYELVGGQRLRASYRRDDGLREDKELVLPEGALVLGPGYAVHWALVRALGLAPGEQRSLPVVLFGLESWRPELARCTVTRLQDERAEEGAAQPGRRYRIAWETPGGESRTELAVGPEGLPHELELRLPFGTLRARLQRAD